MNRHLSVALLSSLFLHALTIAAFEVGWQGGAPQPQVIPVSPAVEFEFIDSPDAEAPPPQEKTRTISDRDSVAQDLEAGEGSVTDPAQPSSQEEALKSIQETPAVPQDGNVRPPPQPASLTRVAMNQAEPQPPAPPSMDMGIPFLKESPIEEIKEIEETPEAPAEKPVPPVPPDKPPVVTVPGEILQHASSSEEAGVERLGEVTFNASKHDLGPYIRKLKQKIWSKWFPLVEFKYSTFVIRGKTVVAFKIHPDGQVSQLAAVEHQGDEYLKAMGMAAVNEAAPFDPLPEGFETIDGEETLDIIFSFYYY